MEENKKTDEEIIEVLDKQIKTKKTLPKKVQADINNSVFQNVMLAIVVMLYFYFINLGYINIKMESYLVDLKVFSVGLMVTAIVIFEIAYKKDDGRIAIHGIEVLLLAIASLFAIHLCIGIPNKYIYIYTLISYIFAIYYIIKSIIIYKKKKKQYILSNAKKITQKDNKMESQESNKQEENEKTNSEEEQKKKKKLKEEKEKKEKKKSKPKKEKKSKKGKRMKKEGDK